MGFQDDPTLIRWRLHLRSSPLRVYQMLATDEGRVRFWAESSVTSDDTFELTYPGGETWRGRVVDNKPPNRLAIEHQGGGVATFDLVSDGRRGTELTLTDTGVAGADRAEWTAAWVSVLLALKAAVDYAVDLHNHDAQHIWDQGYVDN